MGSAQNPETTLRYLILKIFKNCSFAGAFSEYARAMRISSTPRAGVNIHGRKHGG
jgi:hypothetical protein